MSFDFEYAVAILPELGRGLLVTLALTALGMLLALVLGLVWAVARRSGPPPVAATVRAVVDFVRGTPLLIQIYVLYYGLPELGLRPSAFLTGVVALALHYSTYVSEVYRSGIEAVPDGQWQAARALNLGPWTTWRQVVLPQALPPIVPALGNYLVAMFKDTPILAAITVAELLQRAKLLGASSFRYFEPLTLVGLIFLVLSLVSAWLVSKLETRMQEMTR